MATERDAVGQQALILVERGGDMVGDDHGAHRRIGGRHPLRHRDEVGPRVVALAAKPLSQTAETADHLVGDEQNSVAVGELSQAPPIALGRRQATARVLHRLGDDHGHRVWALGAYRCLHLFQ